jgi:DNA-binding CsgD family transcriptional regulator
VTEAEYASARATVLAGGDPSPELMADCLRTVGLLVRTAGLPAHYSPVGVWSDEAVEEVFADWVAVRLVGRGQLLAMLQRAPALRVFRRMAETSVRQHLVDGLTRSQSANLYDRVARLLADDDRFDGSGSGSGRLWRLADGPDAPFDGDERQMLGVAWALGEFRVIQYDAEARKLSPLLEADELDRFVSGLLEAGSMTTGTIMRALQLRFAIEDPAPAVELDAAAEASIGPGPEAAVVIAELVTATLAELTMRQAKVLLGIEQGVPGRELAVQLGCSTGTISHERGRIAAILARLGTDAPAVLKQVLDALFTENA